MPKKLTARDIMEADVIALTPEMTLSDAFKVLVTNQISGAPVVNSENRLVGVISQSDLLREAYSDDDFSAFAPHSYYIGVPYVQGDAIEGMANRLAETTVGQAMNPYVLAVSPDDSIGALANMMCEKKVHRLIVAEDKEIVGIVTAFDLLRLLES